MLQCIIFVPAFFPRAGPADFPKPGDPFRQKLRSPVMLPPVPTPPDMESLARSIENHWVMCRKKDSDRYGRIVAVC